jgi:hypothetical protein
MQISYRLSQQDFFQSLIAHRNRKKWVKWMFRFIIAALCFLVTWSLISVVRHPGAEKITSSVLPPLAMLFVWAFVMWGSPWRLARMQFSKKPSAQGQRSASLNANGIQWQWDGGTSAVEWKTYIHWMETKNQILIFSSPVQFGIIPKRALQPEEVDELRKLLTDHIGVGWRV